MGENKLVIGILSKTQLLSGGYRIPHLSQVQSRVPNAWHKSVQPPFGLVAKSLKKMGQPITGSSNSGPAQPNQNFGQLAVAALLDNESNWRKGSKDKKEYDIIP